MQKKRCLLVPSVTSLLSLILEGAYIIRYSFNKISRAMSFRYAFSDQPFLYLGKFQDYTLLSKYLFRDMFLGLRRGA